MSEVQTRSPGTDNDPGCWHRPSQSRIFCWHPYCISLVQRLWSPRSPFSVFTPGALGSKINTKLTSNKDHTQKRFGDTYSKWLIVYRVETAVCLMDKIRPALSQLRSSSDKNIWLRYLYILRYFADEVVFKWDLWPHLSNSLLVGSLFVFHNKYFHILTKYSYQTNILSLFVLHNKYFHIFTKYSYQTNILNCSVKLFSNYHFLLVLFWFWLKHETKIWRLLDFWFWKMKH